MNTPRYLPIAFLLACSAQDLTAIRSITPTPSPNGHYHMERLDRGLVAMATPTGIFLSWRMFGYEYDPEHPAEIAFDVYRDGEVIATVLDSSNFLDKKGLAQSSYQVAAVYKGQTGLPCPAVKPWSDTYLRIPLQIPPAGTIPKDSECENAGETYRYNANDGMVGDLDGDRRYDLVLKWEPSNARDPSYSGCTGPTLLDGYTLDGSLLWRIDLGPNIRSGPFYAQPLVYDIDGDGKSELVVKTAPGTRDGTGSVLHTGPAATDDDTALYRNLENTPGTTGHIVTGPEYLTIFEGPSGAERASLPFEPSRGDWSEWGDDPKVDRGNRMSRSYASVAFLRDEDDGTASGQPAMVFSRGVGTRTAMAAYAWRDGQMKLLWKVDSRDGTCYTGHGAWSMTVADVEGDGAQEIVLGSAIMNGDGSKRCTTGLGHGVALHAGDFLPDRPGIEVFVAHVTSATQPAYSLYSGASTTCDLVALGPLGGTDRGVVDDIYPGNPGAELWTNNLDFLRSAANNAPVGLLPTTYNFVMWWDGDESRELENQVSIRKYNVSTPLLTCNACTANNASKATPTLTADLLGDWREEIVWREVDNSALRLYSTTAVTKRRLFTLMHDPQYRMQVTAQQTGFNQPPHPGFHIGHGMRDPAKPDILVR